ncbi:type IV pilus twitching motility protein PilT [Prosthecobacter sp.]|uniref:type IV pilus twitching motility protein PilT n=1 Tax=Prosthecobacter sp. TaxID=1965333 RepID=UPI003784DAA8
MRDHDLIEYLAMVINQGGSDLHLSVGAPPTGRLFGQLQPLTDEVLDIGDIRELVFGVLKETQRAKLEQEWELDFAIQVENLGRFRGNACYVLGRIEASFRFIPDQIPELRDLGHGPTVESLCNLRDGLILVTGTSNSGKTTTLSSMTQHISRERQANIVSIEDPIEYVFKHSRSLVRQRQVGSDTHSFAQALRSALRQDANIIIISELRDLETIRTALTAAETGHLVISTLHTQDAPSTVMRVLDAFPEDQQDFVSSQLANCLQGVICQNLMPRLDQDGRVMASEIMVNNQGIASCIRSRRLQQLPSLIQIGANDGMHTIDDSVTHLAIHGFISIDDALLRARDKDFVLTGYERKMHERESRKR